MTGQPASAFLSSLFGLDGKVAIVTGSTGTLGGAMARGLARAGARVVILGRRAEKAEAVAHALQTEGGEAMAAPADVLDKEQLGRARDAVMARWGQIDILVNAAGGGNPLATVQPGQTIFDMAEQALRDNVDLNLFGTVLPCQVFGEVMAQRKSGSVVNISSMSVPRAMTRTVAYSAGKAAAENFTRWLAVEFALKFGPGMRVNAIAPGYFVADQNRRMLLNEDGSLTPRGQLILQHTPFNRFGEPDELVGALIWLCSPAASFVSGATIVVDGGANAFTGI